MDDETEKLARAIYDALEAADPTAFMGEFEPDRSITVDGKFDFRVLAERIRGAIIANAMTVPIPCLCCGGTGELAPSHEHPMPEPCPYCRPDPPA